MLHFGVTVKKSQGKSKCSSESATASISPKRLVKRNKIIFFTPIIFSIDATQQMCNTDLLDDLHTLISFMYN